MGSKNDKQLGDTTGDALPAFFALSPAAAALPTSGLSVAPPTKRALRDLLPLFGEFERLMHEDPADMMIVLPSPKSKNQPVASKSRARGRSGSNAMKAKRRKRSKGGADSGSDEEWTG